jgi:putative serine protease PepD
VVSSPEGPAAPPGSSTGTPGSRRGRIAPIALGLVAALIGVALYVTLVEPDGREAAAPALPPPSTAAPAPTAAEVYRTIVPSVVLVSTDASGPRTGGVGSGVVIDADGRVMTAHHVVSEAGRIEVTFSDGTSTPATILSADPAIDIAILEPERLPDLVVPAVLGGGVRVGDDVYPVGNPLGFTGTFTAGVVSGLGRSVEREDDAGSLEGLIQFDAAVNPGSSGGPLVNEAGQVVGIVTALVNPTEQRTFIGLGFAVPIATAGGAAGEIDR